MSDKKVESLNQVEKSSLAASYAVMALSDAGIEVNFDNIKKIITASGLKVDDFFLKAFASSLKGRDIKSMFAVSAGAPTEAAAPAKPEAKKDDKPKKEEKKEEKKKEPEPVEEDIGMGDLFG